MGTLYKAFTMFLLAIVSIIIFIMIVLGFLLGFDHPFPWILIACLIAIPVIHEKLIAKRKMRWKKSLATGITEIDNDHKRLIELINKFQEATEFNVEHAEVEQALDEVVLYTIHHFAREEQLLEVNNYPDIEAHKKEHQEMITKISECIEEYRINEAMGIDHILDFLKRWLLKHIKHTDKAYIPYMKVTTLDKNER